MEEVSGLDSREGKLTPEIPVTAEADANGLKRSREDTVNEVVVPEKKVAVRERKSRFSDIPPEVEPKSSLHDHAAAVSMVASIINAQLSGLQTSVLASQVQQPLTPKESRELFVGNVLASGVSEAVLKDFLNSAMKQVGLITGPEDPIVTCRMNAKFSFIELRTPEDAKNALNLNGIPFMGQCLKISRPSKYVGPSYQAKTWQEITGQAPVSSTQVTSSDFVPDPATKSFREIFVGNTSPEMTDILIKNFLGGALMEMGLSCSGSENPIVQVRVNGKFSFAEFRTMEEAANALNLSGIPFMQQQLKLSRPSKFEANTLCTFFAWEELLQKFINGELKLITAGPTSRVIRIDNMVSPVELNDAALTEEVVQDTTSECSQFGKVLRVIIPRSDGIVEFTGGPGGIGKVFVEMSTEDEAKLTLINLKGRKFDGKWVDVKFYPVDYFEIGNYGAMLPHSVVCTAGAVPIDRVLKPRIGGVPGLGQAINSFGTASSAVAAIASSGGFGGLNMSMTMLGSNLGVNMGSGTMGSNIGNSMQSPWSVPQGTGNMGGTGIGGLRALSAAELLNLGGGSNAGGYHGYNS